MLQYADLVVLFNKLAAHPHGGERVRSALKPYMKDKESMLSRPPRGKVCGCVCVFIYIYICAYINFMYTSTCNLLSIFEIRIQSSNLGWIGSKARV